MNKSLSSLALLLILISATFANASDNPSSSMAVLKHGSTVKLLYKGIEQNDVKVLIVNDENQVVFSEKIKSTAGFVRPYNFSKLPEGNYSIELIDNKGHQSELVKYKIESTRKLMHVMRVGGTTDKFVLSVPSAIQQKISISIYDDNGRTLYSGKEDIAGDFAKVYNLQKHVGRVTFEVIDSNGKANSFAKDSW